MDQRISQEEVRRIIINDMVKKKNSIVPVIGEDSIVYLDEKIGKEIPFQEFILNEFQKKCPRVTVDDAALTSMKERGYYGLSLLSQYFNDQGRFLDDFMDFVSRNASCIFFGVPFTLLGLFYGSLKRICVILEKLQMS